MGEFTDRKWLVKLTVYFTLELENRRIWWNHSRNSLFGLELWVFQKWPWRNAKLAVWRKKKHLFILKRRNVSKKDNQPNQNLFRGSKKPIVKSLNEANFKLIEKPSDLINDLRKKHFNIRLQKKNGEKWLRGLKKRCKSYPI